MAGTVSSATSSLASELMLNKLMNGQAKTSTGQSITAAGRAMSYSLSNDAYTDRIAKTNMQYGEGLVTAAQAEVTSIKDRLTKIRADLESARTNDSASGTLFKSLGAQALRVFTEMSGTIKTAQYNGKKLFSGNTIKLNAANGLTIDVLGKDMNTGAFKALRASFGSANITNRTKAGDAITAIDKAINQLIARESEYGDSIKNLQNRALLLSDQGASLDEAASAQSVAALSGAGNLLSNMLGGSEA